MASYIQNFIRERKLSKCVLLTTDSGHWELVDESDYKSLKSGKANQPLITRLKDKGIILDQDNIEKVVCQLRDKKSFLSQGACLHIVITTLRCNLKCIYCHASSKPATEMDYDMDEETAKNTVDLIMQAPAKKLTIEFQGGEPLLNFDIIKFITNYANKVAEKKNKHVEFTLVTNLTNMTDEITEFLIENKIFICTSLDGSQVLHDNNRGQYDKVVYWIKKIQDLYREQNIIHTRLNALITITKDSLKHPEEIIDEYLNLGFRGIHLRPLNILGNAKLKLAQISYTAEDYIKFWKKSMDYIIRQNDQGKHFFEYKSLVILKKLFAKYDPNYMDLRSPCGAVIGQMVYNHDGRIFTCDEGRMVEEDLFNIGTVNQDYRSVTTSESACSIIAASINDTQYCDKCAYKPFCGICPVLNYAISGSTITNIPSSDWCKVHMAQFDYIFDKLNDKSARKVFMNWLEKEK